MFSVANMMCTAEASTAVDFQHIAQEAHSDIHVRRVDRQDGHLGASAFVESVGLSVNRRRLP